MPTPTIPRQSLDGYSNLSRVTSHGRGGAGNIGVDEHPHEASPEDPRIPTLKSPVYTTGRGGTGNMAVNDSAHPEFARAAQDVEGELRPPSSSDSFHGGRGGVGNVVHSTDSDLIKLGHEEEEQDPLAAEVVKPEPTKTDYRGWADKGKDYLKEMVKGRK